MGLKEKLRRLSRRAEDRRAEVAVGEAFEVNMQRLLAQTDGTPLPRRAHRLSDNPRYSGTFLDGTKP